MGGEADPLQCRVRFTALTTHRRNVATNHRPEQLAAQAAQAVLGEQVGLDEPLSLPSQAEQGELNPRRFPLDSKQPGNHLDLGTEDL